MKNLLVLLVALLSLGANAQQIHFCSSYTPDGNPLTDADTWNMFEGGGNVYILYRQDWKIGRLGINITIQKLEPGKPSRQILSKELMVPEGQNWVVLDHHFTEEGDYKVLVIKSGERMATRDIHMKSLRPGTHYGNSEFHFTSELNDGKPADKISKVSHQEGGTKVKAYLSCPDMLNCSRITVDTWKRIGNDYSEFVSSQQFEVEPGWLFTHFSQTLQAAGAYKMMVYSDAGVWINSAEIEVE